MNLAIADPPYLGRASDWYGNTMHPSKLSSRYGGTSRISGVRPADNHPHAAEWDDITRHEELVHQLIDNYDGWAIAMAHDNLRDYFSIIPRSVPMRVGVWSKTHSMPGGARVINTWEPLVSRIPEGRRASKGCTLFPRDVLTASVPGVGFAGAKPRAWTRWVLDLLGYEPDVDQVDDLFSGSGLVAAEIAQGVLI